MSYYQLYQHEQPSTVCLLVERTEATFEIKKLHFIKVYPKTLSCYYVLLEKE